MRRRAFPNFIGDVFELEERQLRLELIMRVIGFSPEKPYTLTVNDGTFNRVQIGKINGDYGIKIVDNAGSEIILANGTIVADAIKTGTLDCDLITVTNLDASSITTGYLSATRIQSGTLDCGTMTVSNLKADSITVGTFTNINDRLSAQAIHGEKLQAGTVEANRIVADSITAGQISSHTISGDEIAFETLTGDHLNVRTIKADRIKANVITTTEINYMSGSKLTNASVYGTRIVNSVNLSGHVIADYMNAMSGLSLAVPATVTGAFYIQAGYSIYWTGGEGNIYNVDSIVGYNDIRLYTGGSSKVECHANLDMKDYDIDACNTIWAYNFSNRSDERLKENIVPLESVIETVMALNPMRFSFKKDYGEGIYHLGLTAQDTEKVLPEVVTEDYKGIKGIRYNEIIPVLIKAIQELKEELDLLKGV